VPVDRLGERATEQQTGRATTNGREDVGTHRARPRRRGHIFVLTPAGRKALERAERALESVEDDVLGALTPEERETLHRLLLRAVESEARALATA
jgi:hypothetical protein